MTEPQNKPSSRTRVFVAAAAKGEQFTRGIVLDSLARGEAPLIAGLFDEMFTAGTRHEGTGAIAADAWMSVASKVVIYTDNGVTDDMRDLIDSALASGTTVGVRTIGGFERRITPALAGNLARLGLRVDLEADPYDEDDWRDRASVTHIGLLVRRNPTTGLWGYDFNGDQRKFIAVIDANRDVQIARRGLWTVEPVPAD